MRKKFVDKDYLSREISETLHVPLSITSKVVEQVFLKILKHIMHNRTVRIHQFGKFQAFYKKPKKLKNTFGDDREYTKPKFIPQIKFLPHARRLVAKSLADMAEERCRREKSYEQDAGKPV